MSNDEISNEINSKTSIMDLYAMMGLTINSPLGEVRKAYRNMARVCHPDRGGNTSDMCILKNAFDYIVYQLEHVSLESEKGSFEDREAEFEKFIRSQTETKIPSLNDIEIEALGISQEFINKIKDTITSSIPKEKLDDFFFNMLYREIMFKIMNEEIDVNNYNEIDVLVTTILNSFININNNTNTNNINSIFHASIPGGYGDLIDTSQTPPEVPIKHEFDFGSKELVTYTTQTSCALVSSKHKQNEFYATIPIPEKIEDYSQGAMCDYKAAYTSTIDESAKLLADYEIKNTIRTYDTILEERNELDAHLLTSSKNNAKVTLIYKDIVSTQND